MDGTSTTPSKAEKEEDEEAVVDSTAPVKTEKPIYVKKLAKSIWQNVPVSLNGTVVSSYNKPHSHKIFLEVDLSSDAQYKQIFLACQGQEFEDVPTKFQDNTSLISESIRTCKFRTTLEISSPTQRCILDRYRQISFTWGWSTHSVKPSLELFRFAKKFDKLWAPKFWSKNSKCYLPSLHAGI